MPLAPLIALPRCDTDGGVNPSRGLDDLITTFQVR